MLKSEIRKQVLLQRNKLSDAERRAMNESLLQGFKSLDFARISSIHIFLPILSKNEPDTFLMIDWLQSVHPEIEIVVPKADFEQRTLTNYTYLTKDDLVENQYEIPEPQHAQPFQGIPAVVIVPLLAFDPRGYRVGYGKGFYDRFLKDIKTLKIGLSFFNTPVEITDVHSNDIRLDQCITPDKIITFNK